MNPAVTLTKAALLFAGAFVLGLFCLGAFAEVP